MNLGSFVLSTSVEHYAWTGTVEVLDAASYAALAVGQVFQLSLNGDVWNLVVDEKTATETFETGSYTVKVASPAILWASGKADKLTRSWDADVLAATVLAEVTGGSPYFSWQLGFSDWLIPAGALAVDSSAPIEVINRLATIPGGILTSRKDGVLIARPRFEYPVMAWSFSAPSHRLDDVLHVFSVADSGIDGGEVDTIRVMSSQPITTGLVFEVDNRPNGFNRGDTSFQPGDLVFVRCFRPAGLALAYSSTLGTVDFNQDLSGSELQTETLVFDATVIASTSKPVNDRGLLSVTWIGLTPDATITLKDDRQSLTANIAITAVAVVKYYADYDVVSIIAPILSNGMADYSLMIHAEADALLPVISASVSRGFGVSPDADIVEPLLFSASMATERANAHLDAVSLFRKIRLNSVFIAGLEIGHLVHYVCSSTGVVTIGSVFAIEIRFDGIATLRMDIDLLVLLR